MPRLDGKKLTRVRLVAEKAFGLRQQLWTRICSAEKAEAFARWKLQSLLQ
jgi:hypothetical protein